MKANLETTFNSQAGKLIFINYTIIYLLHLERSGLTHFVPRPLAFTGVDPATSHRSTWPLLIKVNKLIQKKGYKHYRLLEGHLQAKFSSSPN